MHNVRIHLKCGSTLRGEVGLMMMYNSEWLVFSRSHLYQEDLFEFHSVSTIYGNKK